MEQNNKSVSSAANFSYMIGAVATCTVTLLSIVAIVIFGPENNTNTITTLVGLSAPIIGTFGILMLNETHKAMNSRLDELLRSTGKSNLIEGIRQGHRRDLHSGGR